MKGAERAIMKKTLTIGKQPALVLCTILQCLTWIARVGVIIFIGYGISGIGASVYAKLWLDFLKFAVIFATLPFLCFVISFCLSILARFIRNEVDNRPGDDIVFDPTVILNAVKSSIVKKKR